MRRALLNAGLLLAMLLLLAANRTLVGEQGRKNVEIFPNMVRSAAAESFSANSLFADGMAMRRKVPGTVVRGFPPLGYGPGEEDAARAARELSNPFAAADQAALARGGVVFANWCAVCHGPEGAGDGPVSKRGFPTPPSLTAPNAVGLPDGRIFHIATFGRNNMPGYAAQIDRDDRWKAVLHVRSLQAKASAAPPGGATP